MESTAPQLAVIEGRRSFGWVDGLVMLALLGLLWSALHFGKGMLVHFDPATVPQVDSSPSQIPYYAGRTLLRMWIAFCFSLCFAVATGYMAAKNLTARAFILPALDVLQSVPVLGFLSATVTAFMALLPGSLLGVECAAIFAIFTGQVWNMAFGFYHSMVTIPTDMQEAASTYGLTRWQRFRTLELPASAHSLIWNSMMSFGGGWFFVVQSEAISVMNKDIKLPGLGPYMAQAMERGDNRAAFWAVTAMLALILASDQLVWRPLLVWADKFKIELTETSTPATSWIYDLLRGAYLFTWLDTRIWQPLMDKTFRAADRRPRVPARLKVMGAKLLWRAVVGLLLAWIGFEVLTGRVAAAAALHGALTWAVFGHIAWLGFLTALRVAAMTVLAPLIWTAIGVWIGLPRRLLRRHPCHPELGQHPAHRDGHSVVHPVQRDRRCDGHSERSAGGRARLRPAQLEPVAHADSAGDLSVLGDRRPHRRGRRLEREHRGRAGDLGRHNAEGRRTGRLHRHRHQVRRYAADHHQHRRDVALRSEERRVGKE